MKAKVFIGLKNVKLAGIAIKLGDIGAGWEFDLLKNWPRLQDGIIIPETYFLKQEI